MAPETLETIRKLAHREGISTSEWVRRAIKAAMQEAD
jgi:hypothetical protein